MQSPGLVPGVVEHFLKILRSFYKSETQINNIMINMAYCRFENTEEAMEECLNALYNGESLSESEYNAANRIMDLCSEILEYRNSLDELYEEYIRETEEIYDDDYDDNY